MVAGTAVQVLVFPGVLFLLSLAFIYEWIDRKFFAKIQNRYGPLYAGPFGILQPLADFFKLLSKEDIVPAACNSIIFSLSPIIYLALPLTALFTIPIAGASGFIAFDGDIILVIFTFTLMIVTVFLAGWSSMSRFSIIGGTRAALEMLGYEIPMSLAMISPALAARSLSISGIAQWQFNNSIWLIFIQPIGFAVLVLCLLAELEFAPFDIPEAETEIVAGWRTEFSGRKLALFRLGRDFEFVLASALIVSLYLGGAQQLFFVPATLVFIVKTIIVALLFSFLRSLFARFRLDQVVSGMWTYVLPAAILQIVLVQVIF